MYWHIKTKRTFLGVKHGKWNSIGCFCCFYVFILLVEKLVRE